MQQDDDDTRTITEQSTHKQQQEHQQVVEEPAKSIDGYVLFVRNIHEETLEQDIVDLFREYGQVKNINLELERQTGYVKGYALVEFVDKESAQAAILAMNGTEFRDRVLSVDWAFMQGPIDNKYTQYVGKNYNPTAAAAAHHSSRQSRYGSTRRGRGNQRSSYNSSYTGYKRKRSPSPHNNDNSDNRD
jgi:RNA-binding protein 8A